MIANHQVNPDITPVDPRDLKLRMHQKPDGQIICVCYMEYRGPIPDTVTPLVAMPRPMQDSIQETFAAGPAAANPDNDLIQHVLDFEVVHKFEDGTKWFNDVRVTQPWIKRN